MCKFEMYMYICICLFNINFQYSYTYIRKQVNWHTHVSCITVPLVWGSLRSPHLLCTASTIISYVNNLHLHVFHRFPIASLMIVHALYEKESTKVFYYFASGIPRYPAPPYLPRFRLPLGSLWSGASDKIHPATPQSPRRAASSSGPDVPVSVQWPS